MQTSVTKNTTIISKIKKHKEKTTNLFGVGLTSLIAACGLDTNISANKNPDDNNTNNDDNVNDDEDTGSTPGSGTSGPLPFKSLKAPEVSSTDSGITANTSGDTNSLIVELSNGANAAKSLRFTEGKLDANNKVQMYQLTDAENQYDLVISSPSMDTSDGANYQKGKIFIYWDAENVIDETSPHLEIQGGEKNEQIGLEEPEFLHIGGKGNNFDMVIGGKYIDSNVDVNNQSDEGGIFILWDIADYNNAENSNPVISLDPTGTDATSGSLAIYGGQRGDEIGSFPSNFLQLGGKEDNYDMVIRSAGVNKFSGTSDAGGIFILWDVDDYHTTETLHHNIFLDASATGAKSGSLSIYGAKALDYLSNSPEFIQIAGKDDNFDMIIGANNVDKTSSGGGNNNEGAIYVLWDVLDYYSTDAADANKIIDLAVAADASSGLLTVYGKGAQTNLGQDIGNNILYEIDADGNKTLTNIDNDDAGTKDIAFRDDDYTYILFGDKISGTGDDDKVDSKSIDLGIVQGILGAGNAGFFNYNAGIVRVDSVGYRFNGRKADLDAVQAAYDGLPSSLSNTDSDLAVWDIA